MKTKPILGQHCPICGMPTIGIGSDGITRCYSSVVPRCGYRDPPIVRIEVPKFQNFSIGADKPDPIADYYQSVRESLKKSNERELSREMSE